jgi:type III secretory pathway component EscS
LRSISSERRVSVSMSLRAAATSSSRFALPSFVASAIVGLLAGLLEALAVLREQLVGLRALLLGRLDVLADRVRALLQRLADLRERRLREEVHDDPEQQHGPDHQAELRRDEEAAAPLLLRGGDGQQAHDVG